MGLLNKLVLFFTCVVEIYIIFDYFNNFFEIRKQLKNSKIAVWGISILAIILLFIVNLQENAYVNLTGFIALFFVYVTVLFYASIGNRILHMCIAITIFSGCEFLFAILLSIPSYFVRQTSFVQLSEMTWQLISMKLLTYIFFTIVKQFSNKSRKKVSGKIFWMYLCVPVTSFGMMMVTYYANTDFSNNLYVKAFLCIFFALMLIGNIMIFYAFNKYSEEMYNTMQQHMMLIQKDADLKYYQQLSGINKKHEEIIHNTSNYLKIIGELARENRNDNIINIISELNVELEKNETMIFSSNHVLNAILSEKRRSAEDKNVDLKIYVEPGVRFGKINDADLISMFGNLLDNAIRAASEAYKSNKVDVKIFMQNDGNFCVAKIENDFNGVLNKKDNEFITTKTEKGIHGVGIKSVRSTAEKYDGYMECSDSNSIFTVVLILPVY